MLKEIYQNRFDGGMQDDLRSKNPAGCAVSKHFDILTYPNKLVPMRGRTDDTSGQSLLDHLIVGADGLPYGIGEDPSNPTWQLIYKKTSLTGAWSSLAASSSGAVQVSTNLFVEYKDYFYSARTGYIMRSDRAGTTAAASYNALSWTTISQGVVHPADDILYIGYTTSSGCFIWALDGHGGTPSQTALTLPSDRKVTCIVPYGNFLAIATVAVSGSVNRDSIVYLWDRDQTNGDIISETINWGTGSLELLNVLDGFLIGISETGGASAGILDRDSILIKAYSGGNPTVLKEISTRKQTTTTPSVSINQKVNFIFRNRLYFSVNITGGGTSPFYSGVYSLGRNKSTGEFSVTIERMATDGGTETSIIAAVIIGDFMFCVHSSDGTVTTTQNNSDIGVSFSATSSFETLVQDFGTPAQTKKLLRVYVTSEPLPDSDSVILVQYRIDDDINDESAGWTTLITHNTDLGMRAEKSGYNVPHFKEIQFRITSQYGAVPTSLYAQADTISDTV